MSHFFWNGWPVPFTPNDTVASALFHQGVLRFSESESPVNNGIFCGIGQCQACLVQTLSGERVEACLTPCVENARFFSASPSEQAHD